MRKLDRSQALQELARATGRWCIYISFDLAPSWGGDHTEELAISDLLKAAPYLDISEDMQIIGDGVAYIICESQEECNQIYNRTVGDDGPTQLNQYNGPMRVYAVTCGPDGRLGNENT